MKLSFAAFYLWLTSVKLWVCQNHTTSKNTFLISIEYNLNNHCSHMFNQWTGMCLASVIIVSNFMLKKVELVSVHYRCPDNSAHKTLWLMDWVIAERMCSHHRVSHAQHCQLHWMRMDTCSESLLLVKLYETIVWKTYAIGSVGVEKLTIYLD